MINFYKTQDEAKKEKNIANFLRVTFLDEWNRNANNGMLKMNMLRITKRPCVWWQLQNRVSYWPSKWDTSNWGFLSWWRVSIVPLLKTSNSFTKKVTLQILLTTQNGEGRFRDPRMRAIYPNPSQFQGVRELAEFKLSTLVSFILQYTIDMIVNSPDTLYAMIDFIHCTAIPMWSARGKGKCYSGSICEVGHWSHYLLRRWSWQSWMKLNSNLCVWAIL